MGFRTRRRQRELGLRKNPNESIKEFDKRRTPQGKKRKVK